MPRNTDRATTQLSTNVRNMRRVFIAISFLFLYLISLSNVSAHNSGASLEKEVGDYFFDIGYDPVQLTTSEPAVLDFNIQTKERIDEPYTHMWLKVTKDEEIIFASGIAKAQFGRTTAMLLFPKEGNYTMQVRFSNEGNTIAEADFPLQVQNVETQSNTQQFLPYVIGFIGGLVPGIGAAYVWKKQKKE